MEVSFTFRQVEPSEGVKNYAREKISKLQKYLRAPLTADVILSVERHLQTVEVMVHGDGHRFAGTHQSEDMYASIDLVIDKIDRQIRDDKDASADRRKHSGGISQMSGKTEK
ncbi:ribosome hibernation-promoting factor, HPF/YfiA family [Sandaracinus amylolyticus]|uniref:ribosome hibernation-promoting factor, HPF/YfiA family n=1 Tax=Sandaracinus amylolyticus TaxID=927083 RepID=UPI001F00F2CF|nr:ribosome-associated translation inhibitor RaiA [Sandaracinus amylolyticus]UJR79877.1 Ribosome-associated translation inhibitor RaiA [Sandaracinus amylolyticus]